MLAIVALVTIAVIIGLNTSTSFGPIIVVPIIVLILILWIRNSSLVMKRMSDIEQNQLFDDLQKIGVKFTVLDKASEEFIEEPLSQFAGRSYANLGKVRYFTRACFKIEGRNINLIQFEQVSKLYGGDELPEWGWSCNYVVFIDLVGL